MSSSAMTDKKIVKMEFDNSDFEKNTKQTLGTLDKLKEKLEFSDAGKGLENLGDATNKLNGQLGSVGNAAETVSLKFSAIEVAGMTVVYRLTNAFINLGKEMVNSLAIQPVTTGFGKYEQSMNAVQTIIAATDKSLNDVEAQLKRVTFFTDETSYSYSDIVSSIGIRI